MEEVIATVNPIKARLPTPFTVAVSSPRVPLPTQETAGGGMSLHSHQHHINTTTITHCALDTRLASNTLCSSMVHFLGNTQTDLYVALSFSLRVNRSEVRILRGEPENVNKCCEMLLKQTKHRLITNFDAGYLFSILRRFWPVFPYPKLLTGYVEYTGVLFLFWSVLRK